MKEQTNVWWRITKVAIGLVVLSFFLSIIFSFFIGDGFDSFDGNVALIEITGPILAESDGLFFDEIASSEDITKLIRKANREDGIKAIVFKINSPGGSAVASEEIANEIKRVNKTTVAWITEGGTSGAYWAASAADYIIANRMSITGSIGVIASYLGFSGFLEEHNVSYERLVSGHLKDMGSPLKEMTQEEKILFQKSLDSIRSYFIEEIAANRDLSKREVEKIATGQFYLGAEAKELGLVDELGGRDEVIAYLEGQLGEDVDFAKYESKRGFFSSFGDILSRNSFYVGKGIGSVFADKAEKPSSVRIMT
ncbi:MAG: signal peptide peptidase SppA [Nanoarchaeota archaeon]